MRVLFSEIMTGFAAPNETDPEKGYKTGEKGSLHCAIDVTITIDDIDSFIQITGHTAQLSGTVSVPGLGTNRKIIKGTFNLFDIGINKSNNKTEKKMIYEIWFESEQNEKCYFFGQKHLFHNPGQLDALEDMTTLYSKIYKGDRGDDDKLYGAGIIRFHLTDTLDLLKSFKVENVDAENEVDRKMKEVEAITKFFDFAYEEVLEIYFNNLGFFYRTDYQNLVLSGSATVDGRKRDIFFYAGAHDKGFPWGDEETFWDVSLILSHYEDEKLVTTKYVNADVTLKQDMSINIKEGTFSYTGKLYRLKKGYSLSFSDDLLHQKNPELLEEVDAHVEFRFTAAVPTENGNPVEAVVLPFAVPASLNIPLLRYVNNKLSQYFSSRHPLGIHLGIRGVSFNEATIRVDGKDIVTDLESTWGEAENSTFNTVKEPTLFYNYFCSINPAKKGVRVHIEGDVMFDDTTKPLKNIFDHAMSVITKPFGSMEVKLKENTLTRIEHAPKPLSIKDEYILEVNYDHFATGVFQRRVVLISDEMERPVWALEEDMKRINLSRIKADPDQECTTNSPLDHSVSPVAVYKSARNWPVQEENPERDKPGIWDNILSFFNLNNDEVPGGVGKEKRAALERQDKKTVLRKVIQATNFKKALIKKADELGKRRDELLITIKPNFMFLYNKTDHTTYTDPELVLELINFLHENHFKNIYIVEAHSTYGEYFQNRDVLSVAEYIGLKPCDKYKIADLSDQTQWIDPQSPFPEPISDHKVHKVWADADFRISFSKNKTHSYSFYTLCIKNIYGALPYANKFKEYHCKRGIYKSTIEYINRYPIHFGFIDAYISADGPFGIFADKTPNYTRTVIGGENIIAVDWVGASKMGMNPLISEFMQRAVKRFGKPRIHLLGDKKQELYSPWENVPVQMAWSANTILDSHYKIGNIFYSTFSNMDETAFPRKDDSLLTTLARMMNKPIRDMFFNRKLTPETMDEMKKIYASGPFDEPEEES